MSHDNSVKFSFFHPPKESVEAKWLPNLRIAQQVTLVATLIISLAAIALMVLMHFSYVPALSPFYALGGVCLCGLVFGILDVWRHSLAKQHSIPLTPPPSRHGSQDKN